VTKCSFVVSSFEMLALVYKTVRRHIEEDRNLGRD
jgi:hypothetical protein